MGSRIWLGASALVAGVTAAGIFAALIPNGAWTSTSVAAAALVCLSIAGPALLPPIRRATQAGDTESIWLIGPVAIVWGLLLVLSSASLIAALEGVSQLALAGLIAWLGLLFWSWFTSKAIRPIVVNAASQTVRASEDDRAAWAAAILSAQAKARTTEDRLMLVRLAEQVRFAANDIPARRSEQNAAIRELIDRLADATSSPTTLQASVREIEALLQVREISLKQSRSYA